MDYLRELMPKLPTTDFLKKEALLYVESRYGRVSTGWVLALLAEEK
ncbi:MAG: hypothetical protein ACI81P_002372 [Neolewinella sp.]|jgi:hypothetical protein